MAKAAEAMRPIDAPKANIELFRKHEAESRSTRCTASSSSGSSTVRTECP